MFRNKFLRLIVILPLLLLILFITNINSQTKDLTTPNTDNHIFGNLSAVFIADELRKGIIPGVNECWKKVQGLNSKVNEDTFWSQDVFKALEPFHKKIKEIDKTVKDHAPSVVLDPIVNLTTINSIKDATDKVEQNKDGVEWIEKVKVGWIRVQSLVLQISWKYEWIIGHFFEEDNLNDLDFEMEGIIEESRRLYFAWNPVEGRGEGSEKYHLDINELTTFAKIIMTGDEDPKAKHNLFYGLKALLNAGQEEPETENDSNNPPDKPCIGNQTLAGSRRATTNDLIPVYVLLHLLNAEFKYYIIRNLVGMYLCVHERKCDYKKSDELQKHLDEYYDFYFGGIIKAFHTQDDGPRSVNKNDSNAKDWRWRCDPSDKHVEDVTYTRFFDFDTTFVAEERDLSATQSCRETCDSFDGGYTKIPCPEVKWSCLGQEGDFDCLDKTKHAVPCPDPKAVRVCPHGILCETTPMKKAKICLGQDSSRRYLDWIDTGTYKNLLGKQSDCATNSTIELKLKETTERSEITKYEPQGCEVCLCKCTEPLGNDTHRYLGLVPQITNMQNGYVVVGVKFTKIANVIYIKIAEGKLNNGVIDQSTINWIDPSTVKNISDETQVFRLGSESRRLLLDDLSAPSGFKMTGLRFNSISIPIYSDYEKISHEARFSLAEDDTLKWTTFGFVQKEVRLEVQITALNDKGQLDPSTSKWIFNDATSLKRSMIQLNETDDPTLSTEPSLPEPISANAFVTIQSTSLKKDAGQTPVPFFDAQDLIESTGITPITDIGIFLKRQEGYGGFITFRFRSKPKSIPPSDSKYDLWGMIRNGQYSKYTLV